MNRIVLATIGTILMAETTFADLALDAPNLTEPIKTPTTRTAPLSLKGMTSQKEQHRAIAAVFTNTLGMEFVPVPRTEVLFCKWETRVKDFEAFVQATGYDATMVDMWELQKALEVAGLITNVAYTPSNRWARSTRTWRSPGFAQGPTHPVCNVSWDDAHAFCRWLTENERRKGELKENQAYRLPRDWEWSAAIGVEEPRGGTPKEKHGRVKGVYPWGTEPQPPNGVANLPGEELKEEQGFAGLGLHGYHDEYVYTAPVGSFTPNPFGLLDLLGNVWEWCEDPYDGKDDDGRVVRGGSWRYGQGFLLSSSRFVNSSGGRFDDHGFRVVVETSSSASVPDGSGVPQDLVNASKGFRMLAEQGDRSAQCDLATCYASGQGVTVDYMEAEKWYRKAANQGHPMAQAKLGMLYSAGMGVSQDKTEAVKWYRKAAEQGNAEAESLLGICYYTGTGVSRDYAEAFNWLRKAAEQSQSQASAYLGHCYYNGKGVDRNPPQAVRWWTEAATQGDAEAQCALGLCYFKGDPIPRDYAAAVKWLRKAAEQGHTTAQYSLGCCYLKGFGVTADGAQATGWFRKAADQGHGGSQYFLGTLYVTGMGVAKDVAEGMKWLRKAAEQENVEAQALLGSAYYSGEIVGKDYAEAVKWLRKAAEQGDAESQSTLGDCYGRGYGVGVNTVEAAKWCRMAASQGNAHAQFNLGMICYYGLGEKRDPQEGMKWLRAAAEQGNASAQKFIRKAAQ